MIVYVISILDVTVSMTTIYSEAFKEVFVDNQNTEFINVYKVIEMAVFLFVRVCHC